MAKYIATSKTGQTIEFTANDESAARHWVINHLDLSQDWRIEVNPEYTRICKENREALAKFSVREIMDADNDLLIGAMEDFDGALVALPTNSEALVELLTDSQVETLLRYLK